MKRNLLLTFITILALLGVTHLYRSRSPLPSPVPNKIPVVSTTSYANCAAARMAGVAPLHRGDTGYAPKLDRDGDGIACE